MAKRISKRVAPVIEVPSPQECTHPRRVQWTATEFGCLVCKQAFAEAPDGTIQPLLPKEKEGVAMPDWTAPATGSITALGLSAEASRVLRRAHLVTIQDVLDHRDHFLQIRNVGKTLAAEIEQALSVWEARQGSDARAEDA